MNKKGFFVLVLIWSILSIQHSAAQNNIRQIISDSLTQIAKDYILSDTIRKVQVGVNTKQQILTITAADNFGELPFRKENVDRIYAALKTITQQAYPNYKIVAKAYDRPIEELIPNHLNDKKDASRVHAYSNHRTPLVRNISKPYEVEKGLQNRNIALWNSHGMYFNQEEGRWTWQRPRLFLAVEDMLTTSFVLPFLAPMLENAGAQVFIPRERDTQTQEVIVDNDDKTSSTYQETRKSKWETQTAGFSNKQATYKYKENPFKMGTYRSIKTTTNKHDISTAEWIPAIPEKGMYAVYISYQTDKNSTDDAHYTVYHLGGETEFIVNQTMYGGTWLYLGHFLFDEGKNPENGRVELSNISKNKDKTLTADAVKFGGGMGNMAAAPTPKKNGKAKGKSFTPTISNVPRFAESAKYWLQWAGVPDSIYSRTENTIEYNDDFQSRGFWVNYISGGSATNKANPGLKVPIDMAFAFHTDAGIKHNDSIVGTLGICTVRNNGNGNGNGAATRYSTGVSRWAARDLVDVIQTQIVDDIRQTYHPEWTRRGTWNKSYSEARVPEVPTMLLELLSHQNFTDMKYALDPRFRFTVSRSIYKGMLKYLAYNNQQEYVVQPLPVEAFSCEFTAQNKLHLKWIAPNDPMEPTAKAEKFILYTRIDEGGFDNGVLIDKNSAEIAIESGKIYSFKVTALNKGGESFPSEILSAYRHPNQQETVLIVNGFERISGPEHFDFVSLAGFMTDKNAGVPYLYDVAFTGDQYVFNVDSVFADNENPGWGASKKDYDTAVIPGNTFDYPFVHGQSIQNKGYSFVSSSVKSVKIGAINLNKYKVIDLILGKQKQTSFGKMEKEPTFQTFPLDLQIKLSMYCANGGNLLVSGAYIASDSQQNNPQQNYNFVENLLKIKTVEKDTILFSGVLYQSGNREFFKNKKQFEYHHSINDKVYAVEAPDLLQPTHNKAFEICRYEGNHYAAGVAFDGNYKTCALSFPFETIKDQASRDMVMSDILDFLFSKKQ